MPAPSQPSKLLLLLAALVATTAAAGCKPRIGDDCQISTDCSASADRLCDITAPGGYCTVFNCEPGACPEDESLCVQFGAQRSPVEACQDLQSPSPYARSFCMATCDENSDCRDGYRCEDLSDPNNVWGALLIDRDRGKRACVVPLRGKPVSDEGRGEAFGDVCRAELPSNEEPEPGSGGVAGTPAGDAGASGQGQGGVPATPAAGNGSGGQSGGAESGGAGG
jgi:hypothetical protein